MRVFRELGAAVFTAVALLLALSVTQGWNWPLLADARAGIIALVVVGLGACITGGSAAPSWSMRDPLLILSVAVAAVLLVAAVAGLFVNSMPYLVVAMVATAILWLAATLRHILAAAKPGVGRLTTA